MKKNQNQKIIYEKALFQDISRVSIKVNDEANQSLNIS